MNFKIMTSPHGTVCLHNMYETDWNDPEKKAKDTSFVFTKNKIIYSRSQKIRSKLKRNEQNWQERKVLRQVQRKAREIVMVTKGK